MTGKQARRSLIAFFAMALFSASVSQAISRPEIPTGASEKVPDFLTEYERYLGTHKMLRDTAEIPQNPYKPLSHLHFRSKRDHLASQRVPNLLFHNRGKNTFLSLYLQDEKNFGHII